MEANTGYWIFDANAFDERFVNDTHLRFRRKQDEAEDDNDFREVQLSANGLTQQRSEINDTIDANNIDAPPASYAKQLLM